MSAIKGHLAAGCAYTIFGINIIACKDIAACGLIPPIAIFTFRALGASVLFWLISLFLPKEKVPFRDILKIAVASFLGLFVTQLSFLCACSRTTAIDISILSTLTPIFTMFVAAIAVKEKITPKKAFGVALSFTGILFLILNTASNSNGVEKSSVWGILLMMLNALSFASYLGIFRPLISKYSVVTFMKWMFLCSLLISLPFSASDILTVPYAAIPSKVVLELAFLIVMATFVSYLLIPIGQKNLKPTLVGMYSYLQPIIACIIAVSTGMDSFTWQKILATAMVASGVVIVSTLPDKKV